jgi:hypothetical protein
MSQATTRTDESTGTENELNQPKPSTDALLRIYDDARVWLNVEYDRDLERGARIPEKELVAQLEAEGYGHDEATLLLDRFDDDGALDRAPEGVAPTVLRMTVGREEVDV